MGWGRADAITYATDEQGAHDVDQEAAASRDAGLGIEPAGDVDLPFRVRRAIRLRDQAFVDPVRFCRGLVGRLHDGGSSVIEGCRVLGVDDGSPLSVRTELGSVDCDTVVVATLLPIVDPRLHFARSEPAMSYTLVATLREPGPDAMFLSLDQPGRSLRPIASGARPACSGAVVIESVRAVTPSSTRRSCARGWNDTSPSSAFAPNGPRTTS